MRICNKCGTEIFIEEANYCWICGTELQGEETLTKDEGVIDEIAVLEKDDDDGLFVFEISASGEKILSRFKDRNAKHVEIPSDVTSIKDSVFEDYHNIESVILPHGLKVHRQPLLQELHLAEGDQPPHLALLHRLRGICKMHRTDRNSFAKRS